jgi:ABC-type polysaccharide/polyol phosphate transport system ATPase subunit
VTASVAAEGVGIRFLFDRKRRLITPTLARVRRPRAEAWGLHDVTFTFRPGDSVALIGASGAGKTTLLRTIAGVFVPDVGNLDVRGRIASLLSTQAGLLPRLNGRENCVLICVLAGLSLRRAREVVERVKDRSGLGDSFENPVASLSQGMHARLGFAVAEEIDPQVLLLDEVHEALDHEFRMIVQARAQEICRRGGIVVATGHDHSLLQRLCGRALFLRDGKIVADGEFEDVRRVYLGADWTAT